MNFGNAGNMVQKSRIEKTIPKWEQQIEELQILHHILKMFSTSTRSHIRSTCYL